MDTVDRSRFLRLLHEKTGGDEFQRVNMFELGEELGFPKDHTHLVIQDLLKEKKLILNMGGTVGITPLGIEWVEEYNRPLT